ncbi:hypothetical protein [Dyella sp. 20L07]
MATHVQASLPACLAGRGIGKTLALAGKVYMLVLDGSAPIALGDGTLNG